MITEKDRQIIVDELSPMNKENFPLDKPFLGVHSLTNKGMYQFHRLYYSSYTKKLVDESGRVQSQYIYLGWIPMLIYQPATPTIYEKRDKQQEIDDSIDYFSKVAG